VSRDTISRRIKYNLRVAGIDTSNVLPHSVRSSAASAAVRAHVPIDTVLRTAGWSKENTFTKYYKKSITKDTLFSDTILKQN
jgi:site-specific recombinase XerD